MQLRLARLCLDCEEVHDAQKCPLCASETFVYLSRWVPVPERRTQPRPQAEAPQRATATSKKQLVGYGVLGVGLVGVAQWLIKGRQRIEEAAARSEAGELR